MFVFYAKNPIYTNGSNMLKLIKTVSQVTAGNIAIAFEKQESQIYNVIPKFPTREVKTHNH